MKTQKRSFYILIFSVLIVVFSLAYLSTVANAKKSPVAQAQQMQSVMATDRLIVKYKQNINPGGRLGPASAERMNSLSSAAGEDVQYVRPMSGEAHVLQVGERLAEGQIEAIAERIAAMPDVEYAEPDYLLKPTLIPNDTYYTSQWDFFSAYGINLQPAWDITTGSGSVNVAVIDTGITDHADLSGRWAGGYDFIFDSLVGNDGNGRDSDAHDPGDWVTSAENTSGYFAGCGVDDSSWHGTHVAGTIGAAGNNGTGVAGINWNSQIIPVRVLGKCGGYTSDIADGIRWAAGLSVSGIPANPNPAKVLNLSLGGYGTCGTTMQSAITAARTAGAVIVVAAGNESMDASNSEPANCNGVITVAATTSSGNKASYSNYGSTVEISAPGSSILSTLNTGLTSPAADTYVYYNGTSMATPHVAGVASLLFSINPSLTPDEVLYALQKTARAFPVGGSCTTANCGSGIVDAGNAVTWLAAADLPDLVVTNVTLSPASPGKDKPFDVSITVQNQGLATGPVTIYRDVYIGVDPVTTINPLTGCPAAGDYFRSDDFTNLAMGQSDTKTVTVSGGLPEGSYQLWVYVDARCLIQELGETNNGP